MAFSPSMRVLLVYKPWRGGLGEYVRAALMDCLGPDNVTTIATRPQTMPEKIARAADRKGWETRLIDRINTTAYDAAIFIQPLSCFSALTHASKNIVWQVDDAKVSDALLRSMGHIFISDPGYEAPARHAIPPAQFAGVLPFAMLPALHTPATKPAAKPSPMCFIANRDTKRSAWLSAILAAGNPCHIYGNYFMHDPLFFRHPLSFRPSVANAQMQHIYARHRISLNIHADVVQGGTNMRTYEAAGYGIAQLVEYRPGLETLFTPDEEIACFTSMDEWNTQRERLLNDGAFAQRLADNARARVLAEHTYQHRIHTMLSRV
jgi:spore maturation protein CgeB